MYEWMDDWWFLVSLRRFMNEWWFIIVSLLQLKAAANVSSWTKLIVFQCACVNCDKSILLCFWYANGRNSKEYGPKDTHVNWNLRHTSDFVLYTVRPASRPHQKLSSRDSCMQLDDWARSTLDWESEHSHLHIIVRDVDCYFVIYV